MAKKKARPKPDVTPRFPDSPIIRLVQMDGYVQYFFENGINGSAKKKAEIDYLKDRWNSQRQARKQTSSEE